MRDRFLREDVMGIDCGENKDIEVIWRVGLTGSGRATTNVKGIPTTESSFFAPGPAADLEGRELTEVFEVTSCCRTWSRAEIRIGAITFNPPIAERKDLMPVR